MKDGICFVLAAAWVASSIIGVLVIPDLAGIVAPIVYAVLIGSLFYDLPATAHR